MIPGQIVSRRPDVTTHVQDGTHVHNMRAGARGQDAARNPYVPHEEAVSRLRHEEAVNRLRHEEAVNRLRHEEAVNRLRHEEAVNRLRHEEAVNRLRHEEAVNRLRLWLQQAFIASPIRYGDTSDPMQPTTASACIM